MEQLYYVLTQVKDQSEVDKFVQEQYSNSEFGNVLFQVLHKDPSESTPKYDSVFLSKCCFLLKNWAKINWTDMKEEQKDQFFEILKTLILNTQGPHVIYLSDAFIEVAEREYKVKNGNLQLFKKNYDNFFNALSEPQSYSSDQLSALLNIIKFASYSFKAARLDVDPSEPQILFTKIMECIIPYLENHSLLESKEGCKILELVLDCFRYTFFKAKPPIESAAAPLSFSESIESEFIKQSFSNVQLVCVAVRFLKKFYMSKYTKESFSESIQQILQTHFELLSSALEFKVKDDNPDYYLISLILQVIMLFKEDISPEQNVIDIFLASSKLSNDEKSDFIENPNLFYYDIYQNLYVNEKKNPSRLAPSIIASFCVDNDEASFNIISYLISLQPSENVIRCLGRCIKTSEKIEEDEEGKEQKIANLPPNITSYYADLIQNPEYHQDPIIVSSILDFLRYLVPHLPVEQNSAIMDVLPRYFEEYKEINVVITLATRLLKNLIKAGIFPFDDAIKVIIHTLENSFTKHGHDCIKLMSNISKDLVSQYSDEVLEEVFCNILNEMDDFNNDEDDNEEEDKIDKQELEMNNIDSNLKFCGDLIFSNGAHLVKPHLIEIVKKIFEFDQDCYLVDNLVYLLRSIFKSGSQLIPEFIGPIIEACQTDPWDSHSYYLIQPFFQLITDKPEDFVGLKICSFLAEFCMKILTNQEMEEENYWFFGTLLSWMIILDSKNNHELEEENIQLIFQCGVTICSDEDSKIEIVLSFLEILASIAVSYKIFPNEEIVEHMVNAVKSNWALRICQKQLYIIFFLSLTDAQNNVADWAVPLAFDLMNKMAEQASFSNEEKYFSEQEYPVEFDFLILPFDFRSPVESFPINQMTKSALQHCSQEIVAKINQEFHNIISQFDDAGKTE